MNGIPEEGSSVDVGLNTDDLHPNDLEPEVEVDVIQNRSDGDGVEDVEDSRDFVDAVAVPPEEIEPRKPVQEVDSIDIEEMEEEVKGEMMTSDFEKVRELDSDGNCDQNPDTEEQETSGQGEFLDALSDVDTKPQSESTKLDDEDESEDDKEDESDDNIGSVSDDEIMMYKEHDLEEDSFRDLPPSKTVNKSASTDDLLIGYHDDGSSIISDIFTDVNAKLGQLYKSGYGPKSRDASPQASKFDSLRSKYTQPRSYTPKKVLPSYEMRSRAPVYSSWYMDCPSSRSPLGYYLDDEERHVSPYIPL